MIRKAFCVQRNGPVRLVATTRFQSSKVRSSSGTPGALVPALLNTVSRWPNFFTVASNRFLTDMGSHTSVARHSDFSAAMPLLATLSCNASMRRPARATFHPSCKKAIATARPMPEPAPVTMIVLLMVFSFSWDTFCIRSCCLFLHGAGHGRHVIIDEEGIENNHGERTKQCARHQ